MNLYNPSPVPLGLRCCYWHPEYVSECRPFLLEEKIHTEQINIPELFVMNSDQQVLAIELETPAAVKAVRGFEGGEVESPHTITSGLLSHGETNHD